DGGPTERVAGEDEADLGRAAAEVVADGPDEGDGDERVAEGRAGAREPEQPELPFSQRPEATDPTPVPERTPFGGSLPSNSCGTRPVPPVVMDRPVLHAFVRQLVEHERLAELADALPTRARVSESALPLLLATLHERLAPNAGSVDGEALAARPEDPAALRG